MTMRTRPIVLFCLAVLLASCSVNTMTSSSSLPGTIGFTDSDIAAIVTNANQGEIDQGNVALTRASSSDVRDFAQMMVNDHTSALNQANALFSRIYVTANTSNTVAQNLQNGSRQTINALNTYSGTDFDKQYIQTQIDAHQWLLNTLDSTLIPSAHNRELRDFLQSTRTVVATHLDRARQIQKML